MQLPPPVPLAAFLEDAGPDGAHAELLAAEVILGVDIVLQKQYIVFGRKTLRRLVRGGAVRGANVLRMALH
jgi:hypothetical protein